MILLENSKNSSSSIEINNNNNNKNNDIKKESNQDMIEINDQDDEPETELVIDVDDDDDYNNGNNNIDVEDQNHHLIKTSSAVIVSPSLFPLSIHSSSFSSTNTITTSSSILRQSLMINNEQQQQLSSLQSYRARSGTVEHEQLIGGLSLIPSAVPLEMMYEILSVNTVFFRCHAHNCDVKCYDRNLLIAHLLKEHHYQPFRCLIKDCEQSFATM